jgi:hypothetical protein
MRQRFAAQFIIGKLLREQDAKPPRTRIDRFLGRTPLAAASVGWYEGAEGEIEVGAQLSTLPPEWVVFHALPIGGHGWDIDHVLVGPGGVVTINTKQHRGARIWVEQRAVLVGERSVPYIRHARFEAERITTLLQERRPLTHPVHPTVAFVGPRALNYGSLPVDVKIIDARNLVDWLTGLPVVLGPAEQRGIVEVLDNPEMWDDLPVANGSGLMERFTELKAEMRSARLQRRVLCPLELALGGAALAGGIVLATGLGGTLFGG